MNTIKISHFKAFDSEDFNIDLRSSGEKSKNLLIYGINGSGKTSIQDALRYSFFRNSRDEFEKVNPMLPPLEKQSIITNVRNKYRNKKSISPFVVEIDGKNCLLNTFEDYNVFIIRRQDISYPNKIVFQEILENCYISDIDIVPFLQEWADEISLSVTAILKEKFYEDISISFDPTQKWLCTIKDEHHGIAGEFKELETVYNEAVLNLIVILMLTQTALLTKKTDKQNILIFDDFVSSLDIVNRLAITQYFLDSLINYQLIVLTHNANYYNLFLHMINTIPTQHDKWVIANLIKRGDTHYSYVLDDINTAKQLEDSYNSTPPADLNLFGNKIRQTFEVWAHKLITLLMLGGVEETKDIFDQISQSNILFFKKGYSPQRMLRELDTYVNRVPDAHITTENYRKSIINKLEAYKSFETNDITSVIRELCLYQKVVMHPMSHGTEGVINWSEKEIKHSIDLLKKLEHAINSINNSKF